MENVTETSLRLLFELHDRMMNIAEHINQCYSAITVVYVTVSFVYAMFSIFLQTKELFYNVNGDGNQSLIATTHILWTLSYTAIDILLLQMCEGTRETAYETPMLVHQIIQKRPAFLLESNIFYNQLKSFSLKMLHRKKTFNFSGQGLFRFDYTFVFSVSGTKMSFNCANVFNHFDLLRLNRQSALEHHTWLYYFKWTCHSVVTNAHKTKNAMDAISSHQMQNSDDLHRFYESYSGQ